jgi:hypothetical protein
MKLRVIPKLLKFLSIKRFNITGNSQELNDSKMFVIPMISIARIQEETQEEREV